MTFPYCTLTWPVWSTPPDFSLGLISPQTKRESGGAIIGESEVYTQASEGARQWKRVTAVSWSG